MKTIICFGEDWGRHPSTLQFLAKRLAKDARVIWVESLGLRRPSASLADASRIFGKVLKWWRASPPADPAKGGVHVCTPLVLPLHRWRLARMVNKVILSRMIRRLVRRIAKGERPVVVTACPSTADLIGHLGEARSVYYCADDYAHMPGVEASTVRDLEARLLEKVDTMVATSEALLRTRSAAVRSTRLLRHGVDFEHFHSAALPDTPVHPSIMGIRGPIFGFHGLIQSLIDFELIAEVARRRPDWSFVFVGPAPEGLGALPVASNIHYLGAYPYVTMPSFIRAFDVCLIPYKLEDRTRACNPIKLREYLAAGKPVISTMIPEVMPYGEVVKFASTPEELIRQGEWLLQHDDASLVRRRIDRIKDETWDAVAARFREFLE